MHGKSFITSMSVCLEPGFKNCEHHTVQLQRLVRILQTLYIALVYYYSLKEVIYTIKSGWSIVYTVKSVLSGHSKLDKTKVLKTNGSLMKVKSIA